MLVLLQFFYFVLFIKKGRILKWNMHKCKGQNLQYHIVDLNVDINQSNGLQNCISR